MKVNKLPSKMGVDWYFMAFEETKPAFLPFLGVIGIQYAAGFLSVIPIIGVILGVVASFVLTIGSFYFCKEWDENKNVDFKQLIKFIQEPRLILKILPLILVFLGCVILTSLVQWLAVTQLGLGMLPTLLISMIILLPICAMIFSPLLLLFDDVKLLESMQLSVDAMMKNWLPFLVGIVLPALVMIVIAGISMLSTFVSPMFSKYILSALGVIGMVAYGPALMFLYYLTYRTIFKDSVGGDSVGGEGIEVPEL